MIYKGTDSFVDHYSCFYDNVKKVLFPFNTPYKTRKGTQLTLILECHKIELSSAKKRHSRCLRMWVSYGCLHW